MSTSGPLSELLARWEQLRDQGVTLSAEEFCRDTPELLEQFLEALTALRCVGQMVGSSTGTVADPLRIKRTAPPEGWPDLPGYEILGELGKGGIGVVYLARSVRLDRLVALKMLKAGAVAEPAERERFRREGQAMARLEHPHVVPVYAAEEHAGRPFFTMKLLKGGNLAEYLPAMTADPRRAVAVLEKVARAVHYLHQQKILHRDLKPLNILLDEAGEPYVSDFGLAKFLEPGLEMTTPGAPLGTWPYMAPEQILGQHHLLGPATDVWALGVILYEVLTGRRPFAGEDRTDLIKQILSDPPAPLRSLRPELDEGLQGIVARCLQKEPAARYPSAGALADDLAAYLRGDRRVGRPRGLRRIWAVVMRYRLQAAGLLLTALVAVALAQYGPFTDTGDPRKPLPEPPTLTLLGPQGTPSPPRWLAGEKQTKAGPSADGPFSLHGPGLALLELCESVPWPRFRLEAKIRHDESTSGGVGVFFGYRKLRQGQQGYHSFGALEFADRGRFQGRASLQLAQCPETLPEAVRQLSLGDFVPPAPGRPENGPEGRWRELVLEVTPEAFRATWDGQVVAAADVAAVRQREQLVPDWLAGDWGHACQGGIGILVSRGRASFGHVTVRPLP
jgi:predicted Ser/Thr protein kinase